MPDPVLKYENNAIFKFNCTLKLLIDFKIAYSCCSSLEGNLDFPDFLQKTFYAIDYSHRFCYLSNS